MRILRVFTVLVLMALPVKAQEDDIQTVISNQINAFLIDDFATAYSYAAPSIKQIFTSSDHFGAMVQNSYPMVHRPSSFRFTDAKEIAGTLYQNVLIQDQMGRFFIAEYAMTETENGWKIKSVRVYKRPEAGA